MGKGGRPAPHSNGLPCPPPPRKRRGAGSQTADSGLSRHLQGRVLSDKMQPQCPGPRCTRPSAACELAVLCQLGTREAPDSPEPALSSPRRTDGDPAQRGHGQGGPSVHLGTCTPAKPLLPLGPGDPAGPKGRASLSPAGGPGGLSIAVRLWSWMTLLRSPQQDPEQSRGAPCSRPRLPEMQLGVCGCDKSEDGREHFPFFRKIPASSLLLEYSFQDKLFSLQEQLPCPDCSHGFSPPGVWTSRGCMCSRTCQGWWNSLTHVLLWGQPVHQPSETLGAPESLRHKASPRVLVTGWSIVCPGAPGLIRTATPGITPPAPLGGRNPSFTHLEPAPPPSTHVPRTRARLTFSVKVHTVNASGFASHPLS